jgi:uncharacterized membrane protein YczE
MCQHTHVGPMAENVIPLHRPRHPSVKLRWLRLTLECGLVTISIIMLLLNYNIFKNSSICIMHQIINVFVFSYSYMFHISNVVDANSNSHTSHIIAADVSCSFICVSGKYDIHYYMMINVGWDELSLWFKNESQIKTTWRWMMCRFMNWF